MYAHTCISSRYKTQGRCCICGRFMPAVIMSVSANTVQNHDKEYMLDKLRNDVFLVTFERSGLSEKRYVTLMPKYLTGYVGKGTYKKANTTKIFAYDVNEERFCGIDINTITDFEVA